MVDKKTLSFHSKVVEWSDTTGNHYSFCDDNIIWAISRDYCITVLKQENGNHEKITIRFDGTKLFSYAIGGTELALYKLNEVCKIMSPKIWDSIVAKNEDIYLLAGEERAIYWYRKDADIIEKYIDTPIGFGLHRIDNIDDKMIKIVGEDIGNNKGSRRESYLRLDIKSKKWEVLGIAY